MIVQAIALLDDLDKELNTYSMRVKEWFGWHFPEMGKIVTDNLAYAKVIKAMGTVPCLSEISLTALKVSVQTPPKPTFPRFYLKT